MLIAWQSIVSVVSYRCTESLQLSHFSVTSSVSNLVLFSSMSLQNLCGIVKNLYQVINRTCIVKLEPLEKVQLFLNC